MGKITWKKEQKKCMKLRCRFLRRGSRLHRKCRETRCMYRRIWLKKRTQVCKEKTTLVPLEELGARCMLWLTKEQKQCTDKKCNSSKVEKAYVK